MYEKTRGIVLHTIPYNDTLSVVHVYTERYGRVAYTLPRGAGRAAKMARAMYMPLSLLELEVEVRPGREMQRIREARTWLPLPYVQSDPVRAALAMFLAEFLTAALRSHEPQPDLFAYVARSVSLLDRVGCGLGNFHISFLVGFTSFMGIMPDADGYRDGAYFDMQEGIFVTSRPLINESLPPAEASVLPRLLRMDYANMHLFRFTRSERATILDRIISYYRMHLSIGRLSSPAVLHALFD